MANKSLSGAKLVKFGYGQVEDNHLSAPRNGQVYGQLPAHKDIDKLENGMFVAYDYAAGVCTLPAANNTSPIMMVLNEVKIYRDRETDADFAMLKGDYNARIYSPLGQGAGTRTVLSGLGNVEGDRNVQYDVVIGNYQYGIAMPQGTKMVPRVFKMSVGDIYTTNCVNEKVADLAVGNVLQPAADGYLAKTGVAGPKFKVVKIYTMPDMQPAVKLQCIAE